MPPWLPWLWYALWIRWVYTTTYNLLFQTLLEKNSPWNLPPSICPLVLILLKPLGQVRNSFGKVSSCQKWLVISLAEGSLQASFIPVTPLLGEDLIWNWVAWYTLGQCSQISHSPSPLLVTRCSKIQIYVENKNSKRKWDIFLTKYTTSTWFFL